MNNDLFADLLGGTSSRSAKKDVQTLGELHQSNKVTPTQTTQLDLDFLDSYVSKSSQSPSNFDDLLQLDQSSKFSAASNPTPGRSTIDSTINLLDGDFDLLSHHSSSYAAASPKLSSSLPPVKPKEVQKQRFDTPQEVSKGSVRDEALAELIDMGFSISLANSALDSTSNGYDLNEAISYLMDEAHTNSDKRSTTLKNQEGDFGSIVNNLSNDLFSKASFLLNNSRKKLQEGLDSYKKQQIERNNGKPLWMKNAEKYKSHQNTIHDEEGYDDNCERDLNQRTSAQVLQENQSSSKKPAFLDEFIEPVAMVEPIQNGQIKLSNSEAQSEPSPASSQKTNTLKEVSSYHVSFPPLDSKQKSELISIRMEAGASFEKGDYSKAIEYYNQSLLILPALHPLKVMFYSNLALVYSKLGNPKCQLESSTHGMELICTLTSTKKPNIIELSKIEIEPSKNLKSLWIKMLTKKAEALDSLERWTEAKPLYEELISIGECTKSILDGKTRCVKAIDSSKPKPTTIKKQVNKVESKVQSKVQKEAVDRIRKDNIVNAQIESQKFQLHDQIGVQLDNWRKGNEHNIRALICSLDKILWNELNWKPVKLTDLVLDKKVKLNYMKAVSKVHPDKIPNDTSIEKKMIAEGVFITLNQAWEDWKLTN